MEFHHAVRRLCTLLLASSLLLACTAQPPPFAQLSGMLLDARLDEISGLAASRVHEDVLRAMNGCVDLTGVEALGVIETFSLAQALLSADAAAKSADVSLMEIRLGMGIGGKAFVLLTGSVSSAQAAVNAAKNERGAEGMIANTVVIPSPHADLAATLQ